MNQAYSPLIFDISDSFPSFVMTGTVATFYSSFVMTGTIETFYSSFVVVETVVTLYFPVVLTGTVATPYSSFVYLYLAVAWSSELFVFHCGLEYRALGISLWLGVQSYLYFAVAWSCELSVLCCGLEFQALFCEWSGLSGRFSFLPMVWFID